MKKIFRMGLALVTMISMTACGNSGTGQPIASSKVPETSVAATDKACLLYTSGGSSERGWLGWSTVVLIQDNGRNLLFDTGAFNDRPGLLMKLADHHLSPDDIDSVIISHLHFDHIGNIDLFKKAKWYIHQEEIEESGKPGDPVPEPYRLWILRQPNLIVVRKPRMGIMSGIEMIHTPGHTKGSCSLLAVYDKKRILLCADAIKSREDILGTPLSLIHI